jgi:hypothetical protein
MRFNPKVGEELPLSADLVSARTEHVREITRSSIAILMVAASLVALALAAGYGTVAGDFRVLQVLWGVVAAPLGWIIGHYFRGGSDAEDDHARSA